jgi:protein ImuB
MRIAALRVPGFPLQALRRSVPELVEAPLVIAAGPCARDQVVAVSAEAAALGVRAGMTAAQARQVAPATLVGVTPHEVALAADEALADVAGGCSPRIKRWQPGEVLLDVDGLRLRCGSDERIAHELVRGCRHVGLEARVGIAGNVGAALVAAQVACAANAARCWQGTGSLPAPCHGDTVVVPAAGERAFMAPLPLDLLDPAPRLAEALARWGLHSAGALAALPREEIALRLGPEGVALHRLACGEETVAFVPDALRETLREGVALEFPLGEVEPFLFVTSGILSRLTQRLELRGEGFAEVLLELRLEGGARREHRIKLIAPAREVTAVLALIRLQVEANPPGAPVEGVVAQVVPGRLRLTQGALFGPPLPAPGRLAMTLARLAALVGLERVGAPATADTHRPGAWALAPFAPALHGDPAPRVADTGTRTAPPPILRMFRPARDAEVTVADGRPVAVRVDGLGGAVVACAGPYRSCGEWWSGQPWARDDFDVATGDGIALRIFFDRRTRRWQADGVYD